MGSFPATCSTHTTLKSLPPHEQGKVLECTMRIMISVPLWGQWDVYGGVLCEQWTNSHSFFLGFISVLPFCAIAIFWDLIFLCYHRQPLTSAICPLLSHIIYVFIYSSGYSGLLSLGYEHPSQGICQWMTFQFKPGSPLSTSLHSSAFRFFPNLWNLAKGPAWLRHGGHNQHPWFPSLSSMGLYLFLSNNHETT